MDPATVVGLVSASLSIAIQLGTTTKDVCELFKKYKGVKASLDLIASRNLTIKAALAQIKGWCSTPHAREMLSTEMGEGLESALISCSTVMKGICQRLSNVQNSRTTGARYFWEERDLKDDEVKLNSQIAALHLLISALQLPTVHHRQQALSDRGMQAVIRRAADDASTYLDSSRDRRTFDTKTIESQIQDLDKVFSFDEVIVNSLTYRRAFETYLSSNTKSESPSSPGGFSAAATVVPIEVPSQGITFVDPLVSRLSAHLLAAAKARNIPWMKSSLELGADINGMIEGESPLLRCMLDNDLEVVNFLLDHGAQLSSPSMPASILVLAAVASGNDQALDTLLYRGASVDAILPTAHPSYTVIQKIQPDLAIAINRTCGGCTLLHFTTMSGHVGMTKMVLRHSRIVNQQDAMGMTPLRLATDLEHYEVIELLLVHDGDPRLADRKNCQPLHFVQSPAVAKLLVEKGADVNALTAKLDSPLHFAVRNECLTVATLLVENGASVNSYNIRGRTPLHHAAEQDLPKIAELLLNNFPPGDPNAQTLEERETPLHLTCKADSYVTAALLLEHGADMHRVDSKRLTPLHYAGLFNAVQVAQLLVSKGVGIHTRSESWTPLHFAAEKDSLEFAEYVIQNGADIHSVTRLGATPLHIAAQYDSPNVARFLIDHGADIEFLATMRPSPLHVAAAADSLKVARLLLKNGAYPYQKDNFGQNAIDAAKRANASQEMITLLYSQPKSPITHSGRAYSFSSLAVKPE